MTVNGREVGAVLVMVVVMTAPTGGSLAAQELRWTGSTGYATGSYVFDARTHTLSVSNGLTLAAGPFGVSGSLPVLGQNSTLVSQVAGVPLPTGGADHGVISRRRPGDTVGSGRGPGGGGGGMSTDTTVVFADQFDWTVGDPFLNAFATVFEGTGFVRSVQVRSAAKVPVRDVDSGVGTGEWDLGVGGSAFVGVGSFYFFGDLAYWWYGDLPELELVDGLAYGAGVSRSFMDARGSVMVSFLGAQKAIETLDAPASLALSLGYLPRIGRSYSIGAAVGLTEASPDFSIYLGWGVSLAGS